MLDQVSQGGPLSGIKVDAAAPSPGALDSDNPRPGPPRRIDDTALGTISQLRDVTSVLPIIATPMVVVPPPTLPATAHPTRQQNGPIFDSAVGIDLAHVNQLPVTVVAGQLPDPGSQTQIAVTIDFLQRIGVTNADAKAIIGTQVTMGAPRLFNSDVGQRTRVRWTHATIVGVVSQDAGNGLYVVSLELARAARAWCPPRRNSAWRT